MNEAEKSNYDYAELERHLPLCDGANEKLVELSEIHETALNWSDPTGPSPWSQDDFEQFEAEARTIFRHVQTELGDPYSVWYFPLGEEQRRPPKPKHAWTIQVRLELTANHLDLALSNMALDSKLRGWDLRRMTVAEFMATGQIRERATCASFICCGSIRRWIAQRVI